MESTGVPVSAANANAMRLTRLDRGELLGLQYVALSGGDGPTSQAVEKLQVPISTLVVVASPVQRLPQHLYAMPHQPTILVHCKIPLREVVQQIYDTVVESAPDFHSLPPCSCFLRLEFSSNRRRHFPRRTVE
jgi:hypothetical protein